MNRDDMKEEDISEAQTIFKSKRMRERIFSKKEADMPRKYNLEPVSIRIFSEAIDHQNLVRYRERYVLKANFTDVTIPPISSCFESKSTNRVMEKAVASKVYHLIW
ncbi:hypothetical protein AVEN_37550-1 [Araneus ventricosus]|uniref:Uncharacterized protein n=1 Tax=Araneus ventricosus TaxID=182803 RepID=A0A4Y2UQE5_ARAVE|nr:hypothetical protein AVEN_7795-1 [Araneus ventricosus]GBO14371.1 hypothetical protein AVEN_37550-1 [Araneus ventricosus]